MSSQAEGFQVLSNNQTCTIEQSGFLNYQVVLNKTGGIK